MQIARRRIVIALKLVVSLTILSLLIREASMDVSELLDIGTSTLRNLPTLTLAFVLLLAALMIGIVRWRLVAAMLQIHLRYIAAFRYGAAGFAVDYAGLGAIGGDIFKVMCIARANPAARTQATVSVVADRLIGLWALLLVASVAAIWIRAPGHELDTIATATILVATLFFLVLTILFVLAGRLRDASWLNANQRKPVARIIREIVLATMAIRESPREFLIAFCLSLVIQGLNIAALFFIASSLEGEAPGLLEHCIVVPLTLVAASVPLPFEALGVFDYSLSHLYVMSSPGIVLLGQGLVVAMIFRAFGLLIAIAGIVFFAGARDEPAYGYAQRTSTLREAFRAR